MNPFNGLNHDELVAKEKQYRQIAREASINANLCLSIRIYRDTLVMLATAKAAQERARTGICNKGSMLYECPVHQMGSCRLTKSNNP